MALFNDSSSSASRSGEVIFWSVSVFILLIFLGHNALWGLEGRCAEVVREMLLTMDFFHPEINGIPESGRPVLSYWANLPAAILFGIDEFTLRLPAVVAAIILLFSTKMIAGKLFDDQTALVSMWILFSTYGFIFWGKVAAPDMANAAAVSCAVMIFLHWKDDPSLMNYLSFYLMLALGTFFKGVPMVGVVLLLILPVAAVRGKLKQYFCFSNLFALLTGAVIVLLPYIFTQNAVSSAVNPSANSGIEMFWNNQVIRILDARYSGEPVYSYLYHLPRLLFPWSVVFVIAVAGFIKIRKELNREFSALLIGMGMAFGLFCFSGSRRWYYLLPLVPFCSIAIAAALCNWSEKINGMNYTVSIMRAIILIASSIAFALPVILPLQGVVMNYRIPGGVFVCSSIAGFISLLIYTCDQGEDNAAANILGMPHRTASFIFCVSVMFATFFAVVLPQFTVYRTEKPFVTDLQKRLEGIAPENIFIYGGSVNGRVIFYLNQPGPVKNSVDLADFLMDNRSQRVAVIYTNEKQVVGKIKKELDKLSAIPFDYKNPQFVEKRLPHESYDKGKLAAWIINVPENLSKK